jgi:hypothetical protein
MPRNRPKGDDRSSPTNWFAFGISWLCGPIVACGHRGAW